MLASVGSASSAKHHTFALITMNGQQSFFALQAQAAKQEAKKLGVSLLVYDADSSAAKTIAEEQSAIASGADGLMVAPPSIAAGPDIVSIANKAHVPVLAIDNSFNGPNGKPAPLVGIDAAGVGADSGKLLSGAYRKAGWSPDNTYYLSIELPGLETCTLRTTAEKKTFLNLNPTFVSSHILVVPYDGTVENATTNVGPIVVAHPGVAHWLVASCNDDGVVGAGKELIISHVGVSDILGVGLGGDLACQAWGSGAAPSGMVATNYPNAPSLGQLAVRVLYNRVAKNKAMPLQNNVPGIDITPATYTKIVKC